MLNKTLLNNNADLQAWRRDRLDGERHFHIIEPKLYPCTVVWKYTQRIGLDYIYVYPFDPSGGKLQFGRAATDQDTVDVAAWLEQSGYGVKIWRDNFEIAYMDHLLKEQLAEEVK